MCTHTQPVGTSCRVTHTCGLELLLVQHKKNTRILQPWREMVFREHLKTITQKSNSELPIFLQIENTPAKVKPQKYQLI